MKKVVLGFLLIFTFAVVINNAGCVPKSKKTDKTETIKSVEEGSITTKSEEKVETHCPKQCTVADCTKCDKVCCHAECTETECKKVTCEECKKVTTCTKECEKTKDKA